MGEASNEDLTGDQDVAALKADIDQTRESIGQTLEAIGEKLSPGNMVQEAAGTVKDAAARRVGNVMATASERASDLAEQARETVETVRQQVSDNTLPAALVAIGLGWYAFRTIRNGNGRMGRRQYLGAPRWVDEGRDYGADDAQQIMRRVGEISQRASSTVSRVFRQNPLAFGVAAAAVGVAIGLSVPETDVEDRMLGETRDSVMDRAREAVAHPMG